MAFSGGTRFKLVAISKSLTASRDAGGFPLNLSSKPARNTMPSLHPMDTDFARTDSAGVGRDRFDETNVTLGLVGVTHLENEPLRSRRAPSTAATRNSLPNCQTTSAPAYVPTRLNSSCDIYVHGTPTHKCSRQKSVGRYNSCRRNSRHSIVLTAPEGVLATFVNRNP
jgi:hypothetical protein